MNEQELLTEITKAILKFTKEKKIIHPSRDAVFTFVSKIQMQTLVVPYWTNTTSKM